MDDVICASTLQDITKGDNEINNSNLFGFDELQVIVWKGFIKDMNKKYKFAIVAGIVVLVLILGCGITYKQEAKVAENNTTNDADASSNADSADNDLDANQLFDSLEDGSGNVNRNSIKKKASDANAKKNTVKHKESSNSEGNGNSVSGNTNSNGSTSENKNNSSENKGDKKDDNSEPEPDNPSDDKNQYHDKNQDNDKNQVDLTEGGKWTKYY